MPAETAPTVLAPPLLACESLVSAFNRDTSLRGPTAKCIYHHIDDFFFFFFCCRPPMSGECHHFVFPTGSVPVSPSAALFRTFKEWALLPTQPPNLAPTSATRGEAFSLSVGRWVGEWGGEGGGGFGGREASVFAVHFLAVASRWRGFHRGDYVTPNITLPIPPTLCSTDPSSVSLMLPLMRGLPARTSFHFTEGENICWRFNKRV